MSISDYLENAWLNAIRGGGAGTSYTAPSAVYAKLHTADPTDTGTTSPFADKRLVAVTFGAASGGVISLTNTPLWSNLTASGTISHISLWDSNAVNGSSDPTGNCLGAGALSTPKTVASGDDFDLTSLTYTLD